MTEEIRPGDTVLYHAPPPMKVHTWEPDPAWGKRAKVLSVAPSTSSGWTRYHIKGEGFSRLTNATCLSRIEEDG